MNIRQWPSRAFARGHRSIAAATLLLLLAAAMPPLMLPRDRFDLLVGFDVTQSMSVVDVVLDGRSVSRLELARASAAELLRRLPCGSRVGWSIFADYRNLVLLVPIEVCSHYEVLLATLGGIDGRMRWANASQIGKGAYWLMRAGQSTGAGTEVLFFTDGQEAPPLPAGQQAMPALEGETPHGWLVGVGGAVPVPIPRRDAEDRAIGFWRADEVVQQGDGSHEELSELRGDHLQSLGRDTGLAYLPLTTPAELAAEVIATAHAQRRDAPTELRWLPAALALVLLACHFLPGWPIRSTRSTGMAPSPSGRGLG